MTVDMDLITGISVGVEFVAPIPEEDIAPTVIVDLFIVRLLFQWPSS